MWRRRGKNRDSSGRIIIQNILRRGRAATESRLRRIRNDMPVAGKTFCRGRICGENRTLLADFCRPDDDFPILVGYMAHRANFFSNSLTIEGYECVSFTVPSVPVFDDFRFVDNAVDFEETFQLFLCCFVTESFDENTVWNFDISRTMPGVIILFLRICR